MAGLTRYVPRPTSLGTPTARPTRGPAGAQSTEGTAFTHLVEHWADLPAAVQRLDPHSDGLFAEFVTVPHNFPVNVDGAPHQERVAVRAHHHRLVVAMLVRPLGKRPDGRLTPLSTARWAVRDSQVHTPAATPRLVRPTTIPADPPLPHAAHGAGAGGLSRRLQVGAELSMYLPAVVRDDMVAATPDPTVWAGSIVQTWAVDKTAGAQNLVVVRVGASRAVVVQARRGHPAGPMPTGYTAAVMSRLPWVISQITYDLTTARAGLPSGDRGRHQIAR